MHPQVLPDRPTAATQSLVYTYRGAEYTVDLLPKVRLEILVEEDSCDDILDVLISTANTGSAGDGKIWVTHVEEVIRVRTGERGMAAV
ncbi:P-II family nitrogen regulator [Arthrobacter sp. AQ5-05]|uniref:P-II family nitrogen regulator n=1 Tax=Arthrobacter sp. AQ5-05 TaxID=2184581 RepID=UPI00257107B2|nr:P-II family nitrogen regulator [Arthrobacter sp. AQ5-05]